MFSLLLKIKRCIENLEILLTWIRPGSGSGLIKFCGSGYNQSGSTSLVIPNTHVRKYTKKYIYYTSRGLVTLSTKHAAKIPTRNNRKVANCRLLRSFYFFTSLRDLLNVFIY